MKPTGYDVVVAYAQSIQDGQKIACREKIQECERFFRDLENPAYEFDCKDPEFVIRFIETCVSHKEGESLTGEPLLGKPLLLEPWEKFIVYNLLGFRLKGTKERRFKEAFLFIARKNGKTPFAAALALALAFMCLWRVFPHRTASQRGYVMQKNENGSIGVSIRAIEGLIRTCIDKHEAIAKADITVEECRDGIAIGLHIIQAAGVNIPLSVGALQKQIKQYVTACTGVDVYKIRVMVENDASIPVASTYEVQDVTPLPSAEETAEKPMVTPPAQPVAIPATEPEQKPKVPDTFISPEDDEDDERPLHQRLFGTPEQPAFVPAPPEVTEAPEADEVEAAEDAPEETEASAEEAAAAEESAGETVDAADDGEKSAE